MLFKWLFSLLKNICSYFLFGLSLRREWLDLSDDDRIVIEKAYLIIEGLTVSSEK